MEMGKYSEALLVFERAIKTAPNNSDAWHLKAKALTKLGKKEEARAANGKAREIGEQNYILEGRYTMVGEEVQYEEEDI